MSKIRVVIRAGRIKPLRLLMDIKKLKKLLLLLNRKLLNIIRIEGASCNLDACQLTGSPAGTIIDSTI